MRRESFWVWIAALSVAGIGWYLNLVALFLKVDPWGLASALIPETIGLVISGMILRFVCDSCITLAFVLISLGLLNEWTNQSSIEVQRTAVKNRQVIM